MDIIFVSIVAWEQKLWDAKLKTEFIMKSTEKFRNSKYIFFYFGSKRKYFSAYAKILLILLELHIRK